MPTGVFFLFYGKKHSENFFCKITKKDVDKKKNCVIIIIVPCGCGGIGRRASFRC